MKVTLEISHSNSVKLKSSQTFKTFSRTQGFQGQNFTPDLYFVPYFSLLIDSFFDIKSDVFTPVFLLYTYMDVKSFYSCFLFHIHRIIKQTGSTFHPHNNISHYNYLFTRYKRKNSLVHSLSFSFSLASSPFDQCSDYILSWGFLSLFSSPTNFNEREREKI